MHQVLSYQSLIVHTLDVIQQDIDNFVDAVNQQLMDIASSSKSKEIVNLTFDIDYIPKARVLEKGIDAIEEAGWAVRHWINRDGCTIGMSLQMVPKAEEPVTEPKPTSAPQSIVPPVLGAELHQILGEIVFVRGVTIAPFVKWVPLTAMYLGWESHITGLVAMYHFGNPKLLVEFGKSTVAITFGQWTECQITSQKIVDIIEMGYERHHALLRSVSPAHLKAIAMAFSPYITPSSLPDSAPPQEPTVEKPNTDNRVLLIEGRRYAIKTAISAGRTIPYSQRCKVEAINLDNMVTEYWMVVSLPGLKGTCVDVLIEDYLGKDTDYFAKFSQECGINRGNCEYVNYLLERATAGGTLASYSYEIVDSLPDNWKMTIVAHKRHGCTFRRDELCLLCKNGDVYIFVYDPAYSRYLVLKDKKENMKVERWTQSIGAVGVAIGEADSMYQKYLAQS